MAKLTVNKTVFWSSSGKMMSGKVRNILSDHVVVAGPRGTDYILHKSAISIRPAGRIAGLISEAAFKDKPNAPVALEWTFDPVTGEHNMKWVDPGDPNKGGVRACDPSEHPEIGECDEIWKEDTSSAVTELNPELFRPKIAPPRQQLPEQKKVGPTFGPPLKAPEKKAPVLPQRKKLMQ
jgi:hypothetical protein